jgi:hypothetical protein
LLSEYSFNDSCNLLQLNFKMSILFRKDLVLRSICLPDMMLCGSLEVNRRFGGTRRLHFQSSSVGQVFACAGFMLLCFLGHSLTLKMEATCSFETSVGFQQTTRRYIGEDRTLHDRCYENLEP